MKKAVKFLLPFVCLNACLFSSCGNDNRIQLSFGNIHASLIGRENKDDLEHENFTVNELDLKIKNKESFLLVIADTTCACWSDFRPIIKAYVSENNVDCFFLRYDYFLEYASGHNIELTKGTTKLVIYEEGIAKIQIKSSSNSNDKTMKDRTAFNKFMEGNVKLPKAYLIKEEDYSTVTKDGAIIYFERSGCEDCTYLNPTILRNYVKKHADMKNIYVLDCQPWKDNLNDKEYQDKKDNYGLSTVNNPTYGFDTGVFPFLSFVKNNEYISGAVAFNDTISKVDGKYIVSDSYYTTERESKLNYLSKVDQKVIKGLEIPTSDIEDHVEWFSWSKDKAVKYYEPIIDAFLDTYLPQVNYNL